MATSGWLGKISLVSGGFGFDEMKGNVRIDSITHSGGNLTVTGVYGVSYEGVSGGYGYYVYPITAAVSGASYSQVTSGNQRIYTGADPVTASFSTTIPAAAGDTSATFSVDWLYNNSTASNHVDYTIYFDPSYSPPTGLNVTNITPAQNSFTATVSISGWGVGSGTRYRELQVWTNGMVEPRRYQPAYGDSLSGSITANNSSSGTLTILPNTTYTIGGYATNGEANTGSTSFGTSTTLLPTPSFTLTATTANSLSVSYSVPNQGGARSMTLYRKLNSGSWTSVASLSGSGSKSGSFTISSLTPNTSYTVTPKLSASGTSDQTGTAISTVTYPSTPAITLNARNTDNLVFNYSLPNQGGAQTISLQYKLDSGSWTEFASVTSSGAKSGTFTVSNLIPNTSYVVSVRAVSTAATITGNSLTNTTLAPESHAQIGVASTHSATIVYSIDQHGAEDTLYFEYTFDGGSWVIDKTITTAGSEYGSISFTNLAPLSTHTVVCRVRSSNGDITTGDTITFTLQDTQSRMYGSVNGTAKRIKKVYCSVNGTRKRVLKIYGSVNGLAKVVWEEP